MVSFLEFTILIRIVSLLPHILKKELNLLQKKILMNHELGKQLFEVTFWGKDINEKDVLKRKILEMYFPTNK